MVPPFLQKRERMICGRDDVFEAVWTNGIGKVFCSSVGGRVVG